MTRFLCILWLLVLALAASRPCHSQESKNVTKDAEYEIARRGNHVEQTGTIRSNLITAALAPPADDSHKWFITLIGKPGQPEFEQLKRLIATDPDVRPWIDAKDSARSTMHYQIRSVDDATQKDWISGLTGAIEKYGLPMLVIQPPRSGQFGNPATLVKAFRGPTNGKELSDKLRESIVTYVTTRNTGPIQVGISQSSDSVGVAPPFNVAPPAPVAPIPATPLPFDLPPATPVALTIDQVRAACPGATSEFVINVIESKDTNLDIVKLKWDLYRQTHPIPVPATPTPIEPDKEEIVPAHPSKPEPTFPMSVLVTIVLVSCMGPLIGTAAAVMLVERSKKSVGTAASIPINPSIPSGQTITPLFQKPA